MTAQRTRPVGYAIWLIVASVVGWWAAFQLTLDKIIQLENPDAVLGCNISVMIQCGKNLDSWQGEVFGFPNPIIGLTGWMAPMVVGVALLAGARFPRWFWGAFGAGVTFAFGFVCWLIGQSLYAPNLGVLCPWCMLTWAVTIPTFFATVLHLFRNGTFSSSPTVKARAARLMAWVPLATILAYAVVILLAQLRGLDLLGEVAGLLF
ncbi:MULTISPECIES: vitamin K epoxide reductase family protein [Microbacterium]|uniref:Vitamin K epoxide reductase family protein n=1 Tax=Microbacterium resistens TaxID=156977 RepID=A0ABY3RXL5_9MICO|nr:vitamin K epoxide reductase family protein [Microbacterium resistens]MBW1640872.1 vitamin K epoxide reductase family protein [Microbacterium resistens]MDA4892532.1 vitamin K epoxide reductase family protein [Streptomyces sp. MS2A]UGS27187.1 vitamin K epoxide reductase family protein [Microbacterium resistens]